MKIGNFEVIIVSKEILDREMAQQAMLQEALEEISLHDESNTSRCPQIALDTLGAFAVEQEQIEKLKNELESL